MPEMVSSIPISANVLLLKMSLLEIPLDKEFAELIVL